MMIIIIIQIVFYTAAYSTEIALRTLTFKITLNIFWDHIDRLHFINNKLFYYFKYVDLNQWVLRTLQNMSLLTLSLMWFGNSFHCLATDVWSDLSPYIVIYLLGTFKMSRTQIGALSLVYMFWSDHLHTVGVFLSVVWIYETGSCTVIGNVQTASAAGTKLVLYVPLCECL